MSLFAHLILLCLLHLAAPGQDHLFVGIDDPNEVLEITADRRIDANLVIANNARVVVSGATLTVDGKVALMDQGSLELNDATLHIEQDYPHQWEILLSDDAQFKAQSSRLDGGGMRVGITFLDRANGEFSDFSCPDFVAHWSLQDRATAKINQSRSIGELHPQNRAQLQLEECHDFLCWLPVPTGTRSDLTLPPPGAIDDWRYVSPTGSAGQGACSIEIRHGTDVRWGLHLAPRARLSLRDSTLASIAISFAGDDIATVSGMQPGDFDTATFTAVRGGSELKLRNVKVDNWSIRARDRSNIQLRNCTLRDLDVTDEAHLRADNVNVVGSGGLLSVTMLGELILRDSMVAVPAFLSEKAAATLERCRPIPALAAERQASAVLLDSPIPTKLMVKHAASVMLLNIFPAALRAGAEAKIPGAAVIVNGPDSPRLFKGYQLEVSPDSQPRDFSSVTDIIEEQVSLGALGTWDTRDLAPGNFILRLRLFHNQGPPISIERAVTLTE